MLLQTLFPRLKRIVGCKDRNLGGTRAHPWSWGDGLLKTHTNLPRVVHGQCLKARVAKWRNWSAQTRTLWLFSTVLQGNVCQPRLYSKHYDFMVRAQGKHVSPHGTWGLFVPLRAKTVPENHPWNRGASPHWCPTMIPCWGVLQYEWMNEWMNEWMRKWRFLKRRG